MPDAAKNLCKTSKTPGRTQLINFFRSTRNAGWSICPVTAYAKVSKKMRDHWDQVLTGYLLERRALRGLVIVVDIRRGIKDLDQALIDMIRDHLPLHILLTKSDKLSRSAVQKAVAAVEAHLGSPAQRVDAVGARPRWYRSARAGLPRLARRRRWSD